MWTFLAPNGSRIKVTLNRFHFEDHNGYVEISDGLNPDNSNSVSRYTGTEAPGNVISVSNAAYIGVQGLCTLKSSIDFSLEITAENYSG